MMTSMSNVATFSKMIQNVTLDNASQFEVLIIFFVSLNAFLAP